MDKKSSIAEALRIAIENQDSDSAKILDSAISRMEEREEKRKKLKARIDKEFESVEGKPKWNLPV